MKIYQKLIFFLNILAVICTLFSYLSPYVPIEKTTLFAIFGLAFPWLFFTNVLFILFWSLNKPIYTLLSIVCLIIGFNNIDKFFATHGIQEQDPNTQKINVATFNMQVSKSVILIKDEKKRNEKFQEYKSFLKTFKNVDVFCGQEMGHSSHKFMQRAMPEFTHIHHIEDKGTGIYSKFPIVDVGEIDFGTFVNSCVWADIKIKDKLVRIYSVHLQSNRISGQESEIIEAGKWEKETFIGLKDMFGKYQKYSSTRANQAAMIRQHADKISHPYIICGDFNDPPQSYVYHVISKDLHDSFRCAGSGIGTSFNGVIPALRIDYILAKKDFDIYTHKIIKEGHSDHYPIISTLALH